jgi:hypothetical protein
VTTTAAHVATARQLSNFAQKTHYTCSMPLGAYITYAELCDRKPSWEEIVACIKEWPMLTAAVTLMRMNMVLRFSLQEHNRPNFGRLQQIMVNDFTDPDTFRRLRERFVSTQTDQRPVFVPLAVLNVLRLVLVYARENEPLSTVDDPALRFSIGSACLMMNNLLVSAEEERQIKEGNRDARRLGLLVQSLAPFELAFPPIDSHLLLRDGVMFRMLLDDPSIRERIAAECRGFDFKVEFQTRIGISLERWLYVAFTVYNYFLQGGNAFDPHLDFVFLDPTVFAGQTQITPAESKAVLATLSGPMIDLRQEVARDLATDPRFDFVPFRTRPLVPVATNRLACIDLSFVVEKMHTGVHWTLHDSYGNRDAKRDDLFKAWGILFEEYVHCRVHSNLQGCHGQRVGTSSGWCPEVVTRKRHSAQIESQAAPSAWMNCFTPSLPVRRSQSDPPSRSNRMSMSKNGQQARSPTAHSATSCTVFESAGNSNSYPFGSSRTLFLSESNLGPSSSK